jgi:hypothetical protein
MHALALLVMLKVPDAQVEQTRSAVEPPCEETKVPAAQMRLVAQAVAGLPSSSQVSPVQAAAGIFPPGQYCPALHFEHTGSDDTVAAEVCWVPAGQSVAARHIDSFEPVVCVPLGHSAHVRSDMAVAGVTT